jgi:hypothetical protein
VAAEQRRARGAVCLYGESSGGHLALLAAEEISGVDCVATLAAPTDFHLWAQDAAAAGPASGFAYAMAAFVMPLFGSDPLGWTRWEPVTHAERLPAKLLMMTTADDRLVPLDQLTRLPGAETYVAPPGPLAYGHGTTTAAGRDEIRRRLMSLVARAALSAPLR